MKRLVLFSFLLVAGVAHADDDDDSGTAPLDAGETVERVATRAGVEVPVLVHEPAGKPSAIVILFPGGGGHLGLTASGIAKGADNFVVRTRQRYAAGGMVAVVVDAPSDHKESLSTYRVSADAASDAAGVVAWAAKRWAAPIWLVGTSRGTLSAANVVARGVKIHGLVLTSSVTTGATEKATLSDVDVAKIQTTVFVIHHLDDRCPASPLAGADKLRTTLTHAASIGWRTFDGGAKPTGGKCSPLSHHGFLGLDADVVDVITDFIAQH